MRLPSPSRATPPHPGPAPTLTRLPPRSPGPALPAELGRPIASRHRRTRSGASGSSVNLSFRADSYKADEKAQAELAALAADPLPMVLADGEPPASLVCPSCSQIFVDPVIITSGKSTGHTFSRRCVVLGHSDNPPPGYTGAQFDGAMPR